MAVAYTGSANRALLDGLVDGKIARHAPDRGGVVEIATEEARKDYEAQNFSAVGTRPGAYDEERINRARPDVPHLLPPQHFNPTLD